MLQSVIRLSAEGSSKDRAMGLFDSVSTKDCSCRKVRKQKEIKGSGKCVTFNIYEILNISEKSDGLNKTKPTYSESKG